jgi:hypothetical protein
LTISILQTKFQGSSFVQVGRRFVAALCFMPVKCCSVAANAMSILMRERQLELTGEQSRYFDLIRWGIAKQTVNSERQIEDGTQPFQDKNLQFPILLAEKNFNATVAQIFLVTGTDRPVKNTISKAPAAIMPQALSGLKTTRWPDQNY